MVLVDTSVWVEHFKFNNTELVSLLMNNDVVCHPLIIAEIACGTPPQPCNQVLANLHVLNLDVLSSLNETLTLIELALTPVLCQNQVLYPDSV
jgi:predicted nucleic acid-binding protein